MLLAPPTVIDPKDLPMAAPVWKAVAPLVPFYAACYAISGASASAHGPTVTGFVLVGLMLAGSTLQLDLARHGAQVERRYGGHLWQPTSYRAAAQGISFVVKGDI